ncbi:MAG: SpoIIIAH-like family protein [Oscillospiraceae bacterium]|nr:SpoIIIAH-like family protein [Oscillospiraceae bacterium]MBQ8010773.1 SpoIIIAH-like family protein [Oscillospiraceae bacterium]MBQ9110748.1 SpoIIIAH-like family protein [Oscillospiraceae bacterium]
MKKPSIIIGKRQIILSCLSVMLAVAVYINYSLTQSDLTAATPTSELTAEQEHYGDTEFVNAEAQESQPVQETAADAAQDDTAQADAASEDFFARARLEKTTNRDQAVQTLQMIMGGGDLTEDEIITTALNAVEVSNLIECEGNIESMIKSQGFADCVVYLDGESAKVVVKSDGLEASDAALIKDIILGEVSISSENIRIFEVK